MALDEDVDLFLVRVVVRRPGALHRLEERVAGHELVGGLADVEHEVHVLAGEVADPVFARRELGEFRVEDRVGRFGGRAALEERGGLGRRRCAGGRTRRGARTACRTARARTTRRRAPP